MPFWPFGCESEAILSKKFRHGYPDWSVHMEKFFYHMHIWNFLRRKEWRGEISETELSPSENFQLKERRKITALSEVYFHTSSY